MMSALKNWFTPKQRQPSITEQLLRATKAATNEAYRWARRDRRTSHFQPPAQSGDAQIYESYDLMHRRVRSEVINNAQAKRIKSALVDLVVGCGVKTFAWPFAPWEVARVLEELDALQEGEIHPRLLYALESDDLYEEWFNDPQQFDVAGRLSGPEVQRMLMSETVQVGNAILIRVTPPDAQRRMDRGQVPLAYQLIEREQLDTSKDQYFQRSNNKIIGGFEFDSMGRLVGIHYYRRHPFDATYSGTAPYSAPGGNKDSAFVPADRIINLCLFNRPSSSVGASWFDAIGQSSFDRDTFMDAEIKSAAKGALLALIHHTENPHLADTLGLDDDLDTTDAYGNEEVKLGHSPLAVQVGVNEDVKVVESTRPNPNADRFMRLLDRDIAAGGNLSYYTVTGDYASTSFSSTRAAKLDEDQHILPLQQWFGVTVALPIRQEFNRRAAAMGLFRSVSTRSFLANERIYQRLDAIGAGRDLLDPRAETEAAIARLRAGLSTLKIECGRRGLHWIRVLMQTAMEQHVAELFGVTLDYSKGQGGNAAAGNASEAQEEPADAAE